MKGETEARTGSPGGGRGRENGDPRVSSLHGDAPPYALKETVSILNDRLGLYLSEDQRRGLAKGLLIGTAFGAGILAWNLTSMLRRR